MRYISAEAVYYAATSLFMEILLSICSANYQELDVKRQYIHQSAKKVVLMDSSKFAVSSFLEIAQWNEIDILITDIHIAAEMKERLSHDLQVITAAP